MKHPSKTLLKQQMEIKLTKEESEEYFYNALCNGLSLIESYGFVLDYDEPKYEEARKKLVDNKQNSCYDDTLMQLLRDGGTLTMVDIEGDGDGNSTINLNDVHERVQKTDIRHLSDMINENDDGETADVILQFVFFGSIIYS